MKKKKTAPTRPTINTVVVAGNGGQRPTVSRLSPVTTLPVKPKRRKKAPLLNLPKKGTKKRPAFDAFEIKHEYNDGNGSTIQKIEVVAPENGIHEKWALKIIPQVARLLQIPLEVRTRIFEFLFCSYYGVLSPMKRGKGFYNSTDGLKELRSSRDLTFPDSESKHPTEIYLSMSLVCRQIYVEVVGGALLYRMSEFYFGSGGLMRNYLTKINPFHVSRITRIHLKIHLNVNSPTIPRRYINLLGKAHSLKHLTLIIYINKSICDNRFLSLPNGPSLVLREDLCEKIESSKNWRVLKGLKSFDVAFRTDGIVRYLGNVVNADSPRFVAMKEEIKKVVTRIGD